MCVRSGTDAQRKSGPQGRRQAAGGWLRRRLFRGAAAAGAGAADSDDSAASLSTIGSRAVRSLGAASAARARLCRKCPQRCTSLATCAAPYLLAHPFSSFGVCGVHQVSTALWPLPAHHPRQQTSCRSAALRSAWQAGRCPACCSVPRGRACCTLVCAPGSRLARARAQLDSGSFTQTAEGGAASTSGRGKPVRVHAHRKLVKELTELLLTQELAAHEGAPPLGATLAQCLHAGCAVAHAVVVTSAARWALVAQGLAAHDGRPCSTRVPAD